MQKSVDRHNDFESIVRKHQEKVRNTCFRFVKNAEDAEDVAQEVFLQVYESMSHFRGEAELSSWIYRIAVNKSLDFIRLKTRKKRFAKLTSLFGFGEKDEVLDIPVPENPHNELEGKERKQILDWAVNTLPERQKTAITLSRYEGFSNKEVADIMDMSVSAIESLIHRAKKSLHKELHVYYEKHF